VDYSKCILRLGYSTGLIEGAIKGAYSQGKGLLHREGAGLLLKIHIEVVYVEVGL